MAGIYEKLKSFHKDKNDHIKAKSLSQVIDMTLLFYKTTG